MFLDIKANYFNAYPASVNGHFTQTGQPMTLKSEVGELNSTARNFCLFIM